MPFLFEPEQALWLLQPTVMDIQGCCVASKARSEKAIRSPRWDYSGGGRWERGEEREKGPKIDQGTYVCVGCAQSVSPVCCLQPHGPLLTGSSAHGTFQARTPKWVAMSSSRGSSRSRDQTRIAYLSCVGRQVLYHQHHYIIVGKSDRTGWQSVNRSAINRKAEGIRPMELKDEECKVKALQKIAPHIITGILHFIYCALQILEGFFFFKKIEDF